MKGNCLFFALNRWFKNGGYLVIRKSRHGFFPHFIWCKDLKDAEIEHFVPTDPKNVVIKALVHKLFFKGYIKKDDNK